MIKHFVLNLNPSAKYEWDRCSLHNPITADHPTLASWVAEAIGEEAGSFLVAVRLDVTILEKTELERVNHLAAASPESLDRPPIPAIAARVSERSEAIAA